MTRVIAIAVFGLSVMPTLAGAGGQAAAETPASVWREECSARHVAYPPRLLSAESWKAIMAGLPKHFGVDASVEPAVSHTIEQYLVTNSSLRPSRTGTGAPLRITETPWFVRKHREVPLSAWKRPQVKSPANCSACHTGASADNYSDDGVRIPR